jgi:integrase
MQEFVLKAKRKRKGKQTPWNKGKQVGRKLPLNLKEIRAIRARLKSAPRDLALFNLAIDSSLSAADLVQLRVRDIVKGRQLLSRATVRQLKTKRAVQFEMSDETRHAVTAWIAHKKLKPNQFLFPSRLSESPHLSIRQYARALASWVSSIGLDPSAYGTNSMRRTKATLLYRRTKDLQAAQSLLGHTKLSSTALFLGIDGEA